MLQSARSTCLTLARRLATQLYRTVCDPRNEWDVRVNELEVAAALVAIDRIGVDQLRQEAAKNRAASRLLSGFDDDELTLVQEQATGNVATVELGAEHAREQARRASTASR